MEKILSLSGRAEKVLPGIYQHYKGNTYQVHAVGFDENTLDEVVIYQALYGKKLWFVRPLEQFLASVTKKNGEQVRRFTYVE